MEKFFLRCAMLVENCAAAEHESAAVAPVAADVDVGCGVVVVEPVAGGGAADERRAVTHQKRGCHLP